MQIVETLVHDVRFTMYNVCYKRLLLAWLLTSFIILLAILFSGAKGIGLFGCGVVWLIINAGAIFLCMWMKNKVMRVCHLILLLRFYVAYIFLRVFADEPRFGEGGGKSKPNPCTTQDSSGS